MDPKYRPLLFKIGMVLGGILAVLVWMNFARLGGWSILGIILAVWFAMGAVSLILLRRQRRRNR
jgi:lipopolysaccharide export LptBFGC system permease protein LptF